MPKKKEKEFDESETEILAEDEILRLGISIFTPSIVQVALQNSYEFRTFMYYFPIQVLACYASRKILDKYDNPEEVSISLEDVEDLQILHYMNAFFVAGLSQHYTKLVLGRQTFAFRDRPPTKYGYSSLAKSMKHRNDHPFITAQAVKLPSKIHVPPKTFDVKGNRFGFLAEEFAPLEKMFTCYSNVKGKNKTGTVAEFFKNDQRKIRFAKKEDYDQFFRNKDSLIVHSFKPGVRRADFGELSF